MRKKETVRLKGTVKWFDVRKGFGFLSDEDGLDYFVHFSEIQGEGFKKLRNGQQVTFEAGEDARGRSVARNVVEESDVESNTESEMGAAEKMEEQSDPMSALEEEL